MKTKKHEDVFKDFEKSKQKHLERLADKMLKLDDKNKALNQVKIKGKFLDNF